MADSTEGGSQPEEKQAPPPTPTIRHDWYQTQSDVVVDILAKGVKKEGAAVEFSERKLSVAITLPDGSNHQLELNLAHPIEPSKCRFKVLSTKVEVKLRKTVSNQWAALEGTGDPLHLQQPQSGTEDRVHRYPTSAHQPRDWDRLAAEVKSEEKEEKPEGDAALNTLFQQIYKDGSDEVKKAMNKSFVESGGTVLSTNWKEVGEKKVDIKPPDGMEWKRYEV